MNEKLEKQIQQIVGKIHKVAVLDEQGCTSEVRKIITDDTIYLLKSSYEDRYREWLKAEALVLEKLNSIDQIKVPEYYGLIEADDSTHLIMSFENGMTLTSALKRAKNTDEVKSLLKSFGRFLNDLHETQIIEPLNHEYDWLDEQLARAEIYVNTGQTEGSLQLLQKLQSNKPSSVKHTIIHGDCTTDNVLVMDGKVGLFIDVSGMTVGDPRYDESLAIRRFINNEEYLDAFYQGYQRYRVSNQEFCYFDQGLYEFF